MTSEQEWHFHVVEGRQFAQNGSAYFAERATEKAKTLGCRLITIKNISLQNTSGGKWMVTGTAILSKARMIA